jgi:hypothetical protein
LLVRSLWLDEVMLARNITDRSFLGLLSPLDHDQAAPVGFLLLQKLVVAALGPSEWAFRLVPLLASLASLVLFARLTRRFAGPVAGCVVLAMFACSPHLVTAFDKQYAVDVWSALVIVALWFRVSDRGDRVSEYLVYAVAGAGLVWMSHPAPFVLAAAGGVLGIHRLATRQWRSAAWTGAAITTWLVSFGVNFWLCSRHVRDNGFLLAYWRGAFPPAAGLAANLRWVGETLWTTVRYPGHFWSSHLGMGLILLGVIALRRRPQCLGLLVIPIAAALVGAEARAYPFGLRLVMFLVPSLYWLAAAGLDALFARRPVWLRGAGVAAAAGLLFVPLRDAPKMIVSPFRWEESRDVLAAVGERVRPGDVIYVHPNAVHAFAFYGRLLPLGGVTVIDGARGEPEARRQLAGLPAGCRVWLLHTFQDVGPILPMSRKAVEAALVDGRDELDRLTAPGATAILYSPTRASRSAGGFAAAPDR